MKHTSTFKIVLTALFAALICVATMLIQIPIPATGGYANLGDGVILVCAYLISPLYAVIAAGLGSMLADLLAGYASFALGTLVIKAGVALIATLIFNRFGRNARTTSRLVSMIVGKAVKMAKMMNIPVLGIVENYSYLACPDCGKHISVFGESHIDEVAAHYELPVLAKLPIDPKLAAAVDAGKIEDAKLPDELSGALKTVEGLL